MNRSQKVNFLNGVKKGVKSAKDLDQIEYDYSAMTNEQLERIIDMSRPDDKDERAMTLEEFYFLESLPLKAISKGVEIKLPYTSHVLGQLSDDQLDKLIKRAEEQTDWSQVTVEEVYEVMQTKMSYGHLTTKNQAEQVLNSLRNEQNKKNKFFDRNTKR